MTSLPAVLPQSKGANSKKWDVPAIAPLKLEPESFQLSSRLQLNLR